MGVVSEYADFLDQLTRTHDAISDWVARHNTLEPEQEAIQALAQLIKTERRLVKLIEAMERESLHRRRSGDLPDGCEAGQLSPQPKPSAQ
jgi:hypothetical protein